MEIIDIAILIATLASMIVGWFRGLVRESFSIATLFVAIWLAMRLGPAASHWFDGTIDSMDLRLWAGRFLVFVSILVVGVVIGWIMSKIVRLSGLSILDRLLGSFFGVGRAALFLGLFVLAGQYAGLASKPWWLESAIIPYGEYVADWIVEMAPRGMELLRQENEPYINSIN